MPKTETRTRLGPAYLRVLFDSITDGVYSVDVDLNIASWNHGAERITGFTAGEVLGRPCAEFLHHLSLDQSPMCDGLCPLLECLKTGRPSPPVETFISRADGTLHPVSVRGAPLMDTDGRLIGAVEVFRDISQEKELEEFRRELVSIISHELRSPLASLAAYTETLLREDMSFDEPTRRQLLSVIRFETDRLTRLVDNLNDYTQLENGEVRLHVEAISIMELIARTTSYLQAQTKIHNFSIEVQRGLPDIEADPDRLEQVLVNLLSNAMKYSPHGGLIAVRARHRRGEVLVEISDEGTGIPAEDLEKVFQKFYVVDNPLARKTGGSGIGLYVTRGIIEAHGGRIWATSETGRGSTFSFVLPIRHRAVG